MSCGCKSEQKKVDINIANKQIGMEIGSNNKFFKFIVFSMSIPFLFLIIPYVVYILFNFIVLDKNEINLSKHLIKLGQKLKNKKNKEEELDESEFEEIDSNNLELLNVDYIEKKTNDE